MSIAIETYLKKQKILNNLTLYLKELRKDEQSSIRVEINKIVAKTTTDKIN